MNPLAQYLQKYKIQQALFGERLGVSQVHVSRLVRGKSEPTLPLARRIAECTDGEVPVWAWPEFAWLEELTEQAAK